MRMPCRSDAEVAGVEIGNQRVLDDHHLAAVHGEDHIIAGLLGMGHQDLEGRLGGSRGDAEIGEVQPVLAINIVSNSVGSAPQIELELVAARAASQFVVARATPVSLATTAPRLGPFSPR